MTRVLHSMQFPDDNVTAVRTSMPSNYLVLYRHQNSNIYGIGFAEFWQGWCNCSEPGQPKILQYFDPQEGKFKDGEPQND